MLIIKILLIALFGGFTCNYFARAFISWTRYGHVLWPIRRAYIKRNPYYDKVQETISNDEYTFDVKTEIISEYVWKMCENDKLLMAYSCYKCLSVRVCIFFTLCMAYYDLDNVFVLFPIIAINQFINEVH